MASYIPILFTLTNIRIITIKKKVYLSKCRPYWTQFSDSAYPTNSQEKKNCALCADIALTNMQSNAKWVDSISKSKNTQVIITKTGFDIFSYHKKKTWFTRGHQMLRMWNFSIKYNRNLYILMNMPTTPVWQVYFRMDSPNFILSAHHTLPTYDKTYNLPTFSPN